MPSEREVRQNEKWVAIKETVGEIVRLSPGWSVNREAPANKDCDSEFMAAVFGKALRLLPLRAAWRPPWHSSSISPCPDFRAGE